MKIRRYHPEEEKILKKLIQTVLIGIYGSLDPNAKWEDFRDYSAVFVAVEKNKLIGCVAIKKVNNNWAKIKRMYVLPGFQRKGIGKKLLDAAIKFSIENNFSKMILTTYPEMKEAMEFYKKNGFKSVDNARNIYFTNPALKEYNARQKVMERDIK
jgi:ribosomal protein S18 acetylase RimI-like enzyme